jgi:hypothetical protein
LGFGGGMRSIIWKVMPTTSIIQWFTAALTLFFPMLGPILTMGSRFLF